MSAEATQCKHPAGEFEPIVDQRRCEAKGPCVDVCPFDVFELRVVPTQELKGLGWLARLKIRVHGGRQAYAVRAEACEACGLCVDACPERAIRLTRVTRATATT